MPTLLGKLNKHVTINLDGYHYQTSEPFPLLRGAPYPNKLLPKFPSFAMVTIILRNAISLLSLYFCTVPSHSANRYFTYGVLSFYDSAE